MSTRERLVFSHPVRDAASKFLRDHADGAPLFPAGSFASDAALTRRAHKLDAWNGAGPVRRASLAEFLAAQNTSLPHSALHPAQVANLDAAGQANTLFVTTGQQPGLLGGPALALHKALTAVAWARDASARLGRPVVPIFWIAGDDSDLAESNAVEFLEPGATITSLTLDFTDSEDAIPMSLRVIDHAGARAVLESLPASWSPAARAVAAACYAPGRSLTQAFRALLQALLGPEGLLFIDGFDATRRPESQALLRRVTENSPAFHEALLRGTTRLRDALSLPPQVPVRPGTVPVFLLENQRRTRLFASDSGRIYAAGDEGRDLRATLSEKTLLHSALTRPLIVEQLFPALGHVLGPAELRYFAQLADVFPAFGESFPLVAPRRQAMLVPRADLMALEALGFRADELTDLRPSRVRAHLTEQAWRGHPAAAAFPDAEYERFREALKAYETENFPAAANRFETARRRLDRALGYHRDTARALVFAASAAEQFRALQPLLRWCAGGAQDRHLNSLSLWNALEHSSGEFRAHCARVASPTDTVSVYVIDRNEGDTP
jgi:bacillithiol biosynthesis cysteine-adding enzyme BshC